MFLRVRVPGPEDRWFYRNSAHHHAKVLLVKFEHREQQDSVFRTEWWLPVRWCRTDEAAEKVLKKWRDTDRSRREIERILVPVELCPPTVWRYRWLKKAMKVQFKLQGTRHSRTLVMSGEDSEPCAFAVFQQERDREEDEWGPKTYVDIRTFRTKQEMEAALLSRRAWRFTTFKQELYEPIEPVVLERYT